MSWFDVCTIEEIPVRGARCVRTPQGAIGLFRTHDDRIFAIQDRCPHLGGPLTQGIVHGTSVTCPLHNWSVSLETGRALGADQGKVHTLPVRVENGRIALGLDAPAADGE